MSSYPQFPETQAQQPQHFVAQRRPSVVQATAPYQIPQKAFNHHHYNQQQYHTGGGPILSSYKHFNHTQPSVQQDYSSSLPLLSRDFVVRRISEGETGRLKEELKCEACGKGYKHISSLAKHLWEHTPEWNVTKKLLISKHQQVQLLELASILCSMTEPPLTPKTSPSRHPSDSPVQFDNLEPSSTLNSSHSPTPFETANTNNNQHSNHNNNSNGIKFRQNSISHYPPSTAHNHQSLEFTQHTTYLDIKNDNGNESQFYQRKHSISDMPIPSQSHKNSVSTLTSERTLKKPEDYNDANDENDDDEDKSSSKSSERDEDVGVFGAMD